MGLFIKKKVLNEAISVLKYNLGSVEKHLWNLDGQSLATSNKNDDTIL